MKIGFFWIHNLHLSGQIIIFHQPRFPWNKGISLTKPPFGGENSCEFMVNIFLGLLNPVLKKFMTSNLSQCRKIWMSQGVEKILEGQDIFQQTFGTRDPLGEGRCFPRCAECREYLPTLGSKWPHSRGNVGKYSIHGAFGFYWGQHFNGHVLLNQICSLLPSAIVVLEWVKREPKASHRVFGAQLWVRDYLF